MSDFLWDDTNKRLGPVSSVAPSRDIEILQQSPPYEAPKLTPARACFSVSIDLGADDSTCLALILNGEIVKYAMLSNTSKFVPSSEDSMMDLAKAMEPFGAQFERVLASLLQVAQQFSPTILPTSTIPVHLKFRASDPDRILRKFQEDLAEFCKEPEVPELPPAVPIPVVVGCCSIGAEIWRLRKQGCPIHSKPEPYVPEVDTFDFLKP